jgi:hypothetical protein
LPHRPEHWHGNNGPSMNYVIWCGVKMLDDVVVVERREGRIPTTLAIFGHPPASNRESTARALLITRTLITHHIIISFRSCPTREPLARAAAAARQRVSENSPIATMVFRPSVMMMMIIIMKKKAGRSATDNRPRGVVWL